MDEIARAILDAGSSPHTRGTRSPPNGAASRGRDHPRIRGEHRGGVLRQEVGRGIIPAYAGNTVGEFEGYFFDKGSSPHTRGTQSERSPRKPGCRDHPRIRGEHEAGVRLREHAQGIIPAYAGNTVYLRVLHLSPLGSSPHTRGTMPAACGRWSIAGDHPRIRGEHVVLAELLPRVDWIIPAYAGNTVALDGEKLWDVGSSPHTRGTRDAPAAPAACGRDHPRIRGEHKGTMLKVDGMKGIIPAYAGNTIMPKTRI